LSGALVLLSGGLDSLVSLALAREKLQVSFALTFDYGQQAAKKEIAAAVGICNYYSLAHQVVQLPWLKEIDKSALQMTGNLPQMNDKDIDNPDAAGKAAAAVWVPNRNGLFTSIAACFAESLGMEYIIAGFNHEEAVTFPDNSEQFVKRVNDYLELSTLSDVAIWAPTQHMDKTDIVREGIRLGVPWHYMWSCYTGGDSLCGQCESCLRLLRAFKGAGVNYAKLMDR